LLPRLARWHHDFNSTIFRPTFGRDIACHWLFRPKANREHIFICYAAFLHRPTIQDALLIGSAIAGRADDICSLLAFLVVTHSGPAVRTNDGYNVAASTAKLSALDAGKIGTGPPMPQISEWLNQLGMPEYAERFAENDVDLSVLPHLTEQDLKELGVSLGHRRKILAAIASLSGIATATELKTKGTAHHSQQPPVTAPKTAPEAVGERRYLTVMFCDLVGSTGISAQLDAEEWRDLVGAYLEAASGAVTEMGGHVAKKLGDGLMSLFGYPVAHENDAERAARAALAIQRALAELNGKNEGTDKPVLTARIGLETGPAVLDAAGEIYGDVANIAARVQALAEPGTVLVTARVQRQVAGLFVAEERGTHTLKGVPEPTALFKLVRASGGGRRAEHRNLTPLVGRDDEMAMLLRRWDRARQGDGQLVMIVGEPGLGKSRLLEEFHARLVDTPHTWVEWSCSQLLQNTPLHPIAEWGRQRFGGADVPAERRLAEDWHMTIYHKHAKAWAAQGAIMEDIITNFELKSTRLLRVCPCCGHVQDKTFDLNREQETLAEPCPTCQFHFPVMPDTANSTAVFKDAGDSSAPLKDAAE
jgi:class 3 adenylate cyclase